MRRSASLAKELGRKLAEHLEDVSCVNALIGLQSAEWPKAQENEMEVDETGTMEVDDTG